MTDFQSKIFAYLKARPGSYVGTHRIAADVFPERWAKRSGKGALVGHIDRAASYLPNVHREPAPDEHCDTRFIYIRPQ